MTASIRVAAAQPAVVSKDLDRNASNHAAAIEAAGARLVVFPELSLTGYELDADPIEPDDPSLACLVDACLKSHSVALVGAPLKTGAGPLRIGMLRVDGTGIDVAYTKSFLGGSEPTRFEPGHGPGVVEVDGWRVGLGICKDTGVMRHVAGTARLGVDLFAAGLVHRPDELPEQDARGFVIARTCRAPVVFASFAGPTGDVFDRTAGHSTVWAADGSQLARAGSQAGDMAVATLHR